MGWGIYCTNNLYFHKPSFNNKYGVTEEIEECDRNIENAKQSLLVMAASEPKNLIEKDCEVEILTFADEQGKKILRHTASHVLAQAVKRLYPTAKLAIGPAIENGFYYDFDMEVPLNNDDLKKIEDEMKKIVKERLELTYGSQYILNIDSECEQGTDVTIKIPVRKGEICH